MCNKCQDIKVNVEKARKITSYVFDPTHTLTLRNSFTADLNRRFQGIKRDIIDSVVTDDVFGLNDPQGDTLTTNASPGYRAYEFSSSPQKVQQFMDWLKQRIDTGILEVTELQRIGLSTQTPWTNLYVKDSYKRGVMRARYELKKAGYQVPSILDSGGIEVSMATPFHVDRLGLMYTRTFSELKGITAVMDQQITRILTQGMLDGDGPRLLASKMVAAIDGSGAGTLAIRDSVGRMIPAQRRAVIMARTEVIRTHHQAMIQEYRTWEVAGVIVKAEWATAGDERVCAECGSLEGSVWTLAEIQNMIPLHPQCRCIAIPIKV